jgi:LacI family transcriptional regulator
MFMPPSTKISRKSVTMADVAVLARCTQSTVSVVLNDVPNVKISAETRQRIHAAAAALGYARERRPVARAKTACDIAVIFDDLTVCPEAVVAADGVRQFTWETGDIVRVYNCHGDAEMEARTIEAILHGGADAILYSTVRTRQLELPEQLRQTTTPVVLFNCYPKDRAQPSVVPGDVAGGSRATELLIAAGHRRIGHITGEAWMDVSRDRRRGYRDALATADIPFDPALVWEGNWQLRSGYEGTLALMALSRPPTAIFCGNDRMAMGCYEALKQLGLSIPGDVSVVGFDDDDLAAQMIPTLTTLKFPRHLMGAWAAERALSLGAERESNYRVTKIECELVERESVGPVADVGIEQPRLAAGE